MKADYHLHSRYSPDSKCSIKEQVERAIELGLDELVFTDHVDYGLSNNQICDYEEYFKELDKIEKVYGDKIRIKRGIEFGMQVETMNEFQRDFNKYDFDFVILSNHEIGNKELWNQEYQEGKSQDEYQRGYYQAILDMVKEYKDYSVLGHLDAIKRYDLIGKYPDEKVMDIIEEIFKIIIADKRGIEVNTSSYRYGLGGIMPSENILRKYLAMGGRILTIGSDAHKSEDLYDKVDFVKDELKRIGFEEFCTFEKMKPEFHKL